MIRFSCPHCAKSIKVEEDLAGKTRKCPKCDGVFEIPSEPASPQFATTPAFTPPQPTTPPQPVMPPQPTIPAYQPPQPTYQPPTVQPKQVSLDLPRGTASAIAWVYGLLGLATLAGLGIYVSVFFLGQFSAIQEAALSAMFATLFIAGYVLTRSIEKIAKARARR